jgi:hypothetical protein
MFLLCNMDVLLRIVILCRDRRAWGKPSGRGQYHRTERLGTRNLVANLGEPAARLIAAPQAYKLAAS